MPTGHSGEEKTEGEKKNTNTESKAGWVRAAQRDQSLFRRELPPKSGYNNSGPENAARSGNEARGAARRLWSPVCPRRSRNSGGRPRMSTAKPCVTEDVRSNYDTTAIHTMSPSPLWEAVLR